MTVSGRFQFPSVRRTGLFLALILAASVLCAQYSRRPGGGGPFGGGAGFGRGRTTDRGDLPTWENPPAFKNDVFTFARIRFDSFGGGGRGFGQRWNNDYPDCDWNFSLRLKELTAFEVHPDGKVLRLTDPDLFDYPWLYMSSAQQISLDEDEITALRRYLHNGGFLMMDDIWAPQAWRHIREVLQQVLPDCQPQELTLDHEIFHLVYNLKKLPQVPSIRAWRQGHKFEYWHGDPEGDEDPHFYGYNDDKGRLMVLVCHNNDIGDGWEREGEDIEYFKEYSEQHSYPLGINIVTYVMTH
jgi:hypothetical protein